MDSPIVIGGNNPCQQVDKVRVLLLLLFIAWLLRDKRLEQNAQHLHRTVA